ncbi:hypothetical protein HF086_017942 [Spodoptera exigua]|uniref:Uncharacterized protein n=1 Tax=Spodoptera exigua TaxID=7107 RepID=A0A922M1F1_SPOEX|nr:hypothetical protein HF086_017942 [Spodoptera exigua]
MWSNLIYIVPIAWFLMVSARADVQRGRTNDDKEHNLFHSKKRTDRNRLTSTTGRAFVRDEVVEKFVETLMSSERYLKMIESVERKVNHLDTTFHERTNSILKYLSEIVTMLKSPSSATIENALTHFKTDLEKLKQTLSERTDDTHIQGK